MADENKENSTSKFSDFSKAQPRLSRLINKWQAIRNRAEQNRLVRFVEVDVEQMQRNGELAPDETLLPKRVADVNITREEPQFIKYIKSSNRYAVFRDVEEPQQSTTVLETEFTTGMRYEGWELPFIKVRDGAAVHGWDFVEVVFDIEKPFHVAIEHVGHENLIFPTDSKDLQSAELIIRRYDITPAKLRSWVSKFGFDSAEVETLIGSKAQEHEDENLEVYKCFYKEEGIVYVGWFAKEHTSKWLKEPHRLFLGRAEKIIVETEVPGSPDPLSGILSEPSTVSTESWEDVNETQYPYHPLFYRETEQSAITDHNKGRIFLDREQQDIQTALWSSLVTNFLKSTAVYASPKQPDGNGAPLQRMPEVELVDGGYYNQPIEFWFKPPPPDGFLRALRELEVGNQSDTGQISYAVSNRKDARKTAKEIESAESKQAELGSVHVVMFSIFMHSVVSQVWSIVQSQAQQGLIEFLVVNGTNDIELISRKYVILPAGDIDVLEKEQRQQRRKALWPIVSETALAMPLLIDIIKADLPEDAARYEQHLLQQTQKDEMIKKLIMLLNSSVEAKVEAEGGEVNPQEQQAIQAINKEAEQILANPLAV